MSQDLSQRDDAAGADDLTRIEGIGSRRAERLGAAGIRAYADLASRSRGEIAKVLPDVRPAKIDAWRDTARELAFGQSTPAVPEPSAAARPEPAQPHPSEMAGAPDGPERARSASSAVLSVDQAPLRAAEPFTMTMTIELAGAASHADRLAYSAVVVAVPLTGGPKQTVAKSAGLLATTCSAISIDAAGLPSGTYLLDAAVSLRAPGADRRLDLAGIAEGLLVQVLSG